MTASLFQDRLHLPSRTTARRKKSARDRGIRPSVEGMESRLLMTGGGPAYSDHVDFDGLEFAIVGDAGLKFQAGTVNGQAVESVVGAKVAVGKEVADADFAAGFKPVLFLNGTAIPGTSNASSSVTLFTATAATSATTGNAHGEFSTTGDIEGRYAGTYHGLVGNGSTNTLYVGELLAPGGDSFSNAGGVSVGVGPVSFNASNFGVDTANNALSMQGKASINALSSSAAQVNIAANVSIDSAGIHLDGLNGSIAMATGQKVSAGGVELTNGSLSVGYSKANSEVDLAGTVTVGTEVLPGTERGPELTVNLGALNADRTIKTPGIAIVDGSLASLSGSVASTSTFRAAGITFSPESLGVSYDFNTHDLAVDGQAKLAWGTGTDAGSVQVKLGDASKHGLVIRGGRLQTLDGSVDANFSLLGLRYTVDQLTVGYQFGEGVTIYGGVSVTNDTNGPKTFNNLSALLGTAASPGIVIQGGTLRHLDVSVSGAFKLYGVEVAADGLHAVYDAAASTLDLTGSVDVKLTDAIQGRVSLPDRGITINTATGAVDVNNLELRFGANYGALKINYVDIKYASAGTSYSFDASGKVTLPGTGAVINAGLKLDNGTLTDLYLTYDAEGSSGLALGQSGVYLIYAHGDLRNLNDPSNLVITLSAALTAGPSMTVNGSRYSALLAEGTITVTPGSIDLAGSVHIVSAGTISWDDKDKQTVTSFNDYLGSGTGSLSLNWGKGLYTASADLHLYGNVFNAHADLTITGAGDVTVNAKADVTVPNGVPWIGGETLGSANFYLQIRPYLDASQSYAKAWVHSSWFGTAGIEYNLASGFDYFFGDPGIPKPAVQQGSSYSATFAVGAGVNDEVVTISGPAFKDPNYAATLGLSRIVVGHHVPFFGGTIPAFQTISLAGYPSLPQGGLVGIDPAAGTLTLSLKSVLQLSGNLPADSYSIKLLAPSPLSQGPTFRADSSYAAPSLSVGQPILSPSFWHQNGQLVIGPVVTAIIPLNASVYDPNATTASNPSTISLFAATPPAGTSTNDNEGTLIATFPYALYRTVQLPFLGPIAIRQQSGTLTLPNGYVTYQNYVPVSFTWTTYAEAAVLGAAGASYVFGQIDDGENTPARSAQTWSVGTPTDPTPRVGNVAPIATDFSRPVSLGGLSLSEPGNWPISVTVTDGSGYGTILSGAGSGRTVTYTTGTTNPVADASAFLNSLYDDVPMDLSTGLPAPGFPGHDEVTVDVTTLVGPDHVPYTTERTIHLGRPNADLLVGQSETVPPIFQPNPGNTATLILSVTNQPAAGSETATDVVVMDALPPGVTVRVAPGGLGQGTFDPATGRWSVGTLTVGQTAFLRLIVTFPPGYSALTVDTNNTIVATADQPDIYPSDAVNVARLRRPASIFG